MGASALLRTDNCESCTEHAAVPVSLAALPRVSAARRRRFGSNCRAGMRCPLWLTGSSRSVTSKCPSSARHPTTNVSGHSHSGHRLQAKVVPRPVGTNPTGLSCVPIMFDSLEPPRGTVVYGGSS